MVSQNCFSLVTGGVLNPGFGGDTLGHLVGIKLELAGVAN